MEFITFITPNNFEWDDTRKKWVVTFTHDALSTYFNSDYDAYVVKCLRVDGESYRTVILHYEVTETGDVRLFFDEKFAARIAIAQSA